MRRCRASSWPIAGLVVGCAVAYGASGLIRSLLWGVKENDPLTFVAVVGALLAVAIDGERDARACAFGRHRMRDGSTLTQSTEQMSSIPCLRGAYVTVTCCRLPTSR